MALYDYSHSQAKARLTKRIVTSIRASHRHRLKPTATNRKPATRVQMSPRSGLPTRSHRFMMFHKLIGGSRPATNDVSEINGGMVAMARRLKSRATHGKVRLRGLRANRAVSRRRATWLYVARDFSRRA